MSAIASAIGCLYRQYIASPVTELAGKQFVRVRKTRSQTRTQEMSPSVRQGKIMEAGGSNPDLLNAIQALSQLTTAPIFVYYLIHSPGKSTR